MPSSQIKPGLRVAITAGAAGIGRTIAEVMLSHDAQVHICDIDEPSIARFQSDFPEAHVTHADVTNPEQVSAFFRDIEANLGGLDVLVNNAGIAGPTAKIEDTGIEAWRRTIDVNLNGAFLCTRLAVPLLQQSGNARLVNISSVAGRLGYPQRSAYAASKWALIGLTESLAMELGPQGICVNAVLPGIVEGQRMQAVIQARADKEGMSHEAMQQRYLSSISLRHMVTACDVAATVLFLCSPAGANITGQSLSVCGNVESLG